MVVPRKGTRDFARFSQSHADKAVAVANDHDCAEAEAPATLDHFGNTIHAHNALLEFDVTQIEFRHSYPLKLQAASARAFGHGPHTSVVKIATAVEDHRLYALLFGALC
jgi:hypothetical protein